MRKIWSDIAWKEYLEWQAQDKRTLAKINNLIKDIERNGTDGLGKTERLKYFDAWSKRIDKENRLVFDIDDDAILIISCKGHYEDIH